MGKIVNWRADILHNAVNNIGGSGRLLLLFGGTVFQKFLWTNLTLALLSSILFVAWVPSAAGLISFMGSISAKWLRFRIPSRLDYDIILYLCKSQAPEFQK
mmetsp:Transcript_2714/g.6799  ORF Transcript_2714/g.6799 Transcript_2714/m.6799 type:complete len:101 (-) Transcript_2714:1602-1904(-)